MLEPEARAGAPEQFIFAGAGAHILIQVKLEPDQRNCSIALSSRS